MAQPVSSSYGSSEHQFGQLWLPDASPPLAGWPVAALIHGGFWRSAWDLELMNDMAASLVSRGVAAWNIEYRRVGHDGGGWPGTGDDVVNGINHLMSLRATHPIDPARVALVGHSAGGHLALWASTSAQIQPSLHLSLGLAPVGDLVDGHNNGVGNGAISDFLGGSPHDVPDRYRNASPVAALQDMRVLSEWVPQAIVQGTEDEDVPLDHVTNYVDQVRAADLSISYDVFDGVGHMELIDPSHPAWAQAQQRVIRAIAPNVVLTGFMGTGKSTVGAALANLLNYDFIDTDTLIESEHGPIPTIFADEGEARFREIERATARHLAERTELVISTGGGMMLDRRNETVLSATGRIVTLEVPPAEILRRVGNVSSRPLLDGPDPEARIAELLAARAPSYRRFEAVDADRPVATVAASILDLLRTVQI